LANEDLVQQIPKATSEGPNGHLNYV